MIEQKEKELRTSIMANYSRIKEVERELAELQIQLQVCVCVFVCAYAYHWYVRMRMCIGTSAAELTACMLSVSEVNAAFVMVR